MHATTGLQKQHSDDIGNSRQLSLWIIMYFWDDESRGTNKHRDTTCTGTGGGVGDGLTFIVSSLNAAALVIT